ncbi:hydantoinase/oxoprolinase family protein [Metallosphaera javensis (ex Hofmann et al. 2022)]|uniref:hydantoinase/oxoprolinase family protein n=1 Tax=Metallosphaera javensis (ex Hofmann et al. 2022) TaxID=99938 RepID=UPI001EDF8409|nr:hydantoinase/oxoprolinase family protein [Metallosphaera javensis (ex Hofmann et al. 2022)]
MECRVAIDVGGTFTDFVTLRDGEIVTVKTLTNPTRPAQVIRDVLSSMECAPSEVVHATTLATNALLGQEKLDLPRTALLTTKGFRDVVEIGRQNRPRLYDLYFQKPRQLVPRELRIEVDERVDAQGNVLRKVREEEIEAISERLRKEGVKSVAVSYLHSYLNPDNEERTGRVLSRHFRYVSLSSRVSPEPREYERTSTTLVNAVLMPFISSYLEELRFIPNLYIMSSSGGLVDVEEATSRPVQLVESGPASGVVASASLFPGQVISFDMGGTTAKAGVVLDGRFEITTEYEVGGEVHHGRVVKGSGYPIRFPFVDLAEVSAGGGTVIWRDEAGALRVGPVSAGADPGPMCYGRGGEKPTITDANLVLGRVGEFLAGGLKLNRELAMRGLSFLGDPHEVSKEALELVNLEMARAIRLVTVERGLDPSGFTLVAFGGAGPQHALYLAEELGIRTVKVPPYPGLFSAMGLLLADWRFEARKSYPQDLEAEFAQLERSLAERLRGKVDLFLRYADVRYQGQGWELTVPVSDSSEIRRIFDEKHLSTYGFVLDREIEIVTIRVFAVRRRPLSLSIRFGQGDAPTGRRRVFLDEEWAEVNVYTREKLRRGFKVKGPAIIEEFSSTTVVRDGWEATIDDSITLVRP